MLSDFKKFILRDNVVNLAIGFTVGATFTNVVKSLVNDVIMPPIGYVLGNTDFSNLYLVIKPGNPTPPYDTLSAAQSAGAVTVNYGLFLNNVMSLLIIAFAMYFIIKIASGFNKRLETELGLNLLSTPKKKSHKCPFCYQEINPKATRCPHCTSKIGTNKT